MCAMFILLFLAPLFFFFILNPSLERREKKKHQKQKDIGSYTTNELMYVCILYTMLVIIMDNRVEAYFHITHHQNEWNSNTNSGHSERGKRRRKKNVDRHPSLLPKHKKFRVHTDSTNNVKCLSRSCSCSHSAVRLFISRWLCCYRQFHQYNQFFGRMSTQNNNDEISIVPVHKIKY